jgi:hypothetical protein
LQKIFLLKYFYPVAILYFRVIILVSGFLPYLLIFPEKNHGILAGKYVRSAAHIRVEANTKRKRIFKAPSLMGPFLLIYRFVLR